ncbi:hypothetical protein CNBB3940 [Cryptococcus deneoformans B-3501A]|uniref:hypothetical protein n=1 Tax=Cryptococcus deneoformans (strain B-3501A) TaxID=283643 RepID=UPI000042FAAF|nr:hypothetical protein CNBB3940 [Cryptococcus neoformans var. neoformans B-3501A]EAL22516.1 hypothetical protein CNBB3940 [Cryptococcus neoformans var. neoformans B-3501A]
MPIMDYLTANTASRTPTASSSSIDSLSGSSDTKAYKQSRSKSFGGVFKRHRLSWGGPSIEKFRLGERDSSNEDCSGGIGGKPYNEQQPLDNLNGQSYVNHIRRSSDSSQLIRDLRKGNESEDFKAIDTYRLPGIGFVGTNASKDAIERPPWRSIRCEESSGSLLSPGWSPALSDRLYEDLAPAPQNPSHRYLTPQDSYSLLLTYQSSAVTSHSSFDVSTSSRCPIDQKMSSSSADQELSPEWHQIVDKSLCDSLDKMEQRRQGLWWEIIKGEREYVRDMGIMHHVFIQELRDCRPPVIESTKLEPFIAEVFSTAVILSHAHETILRNLMERQRIEWPLLTTATDIYLQIMLEIVDPYEAYMKNYPFAEARVRRESVKNQEFHKFLELRNTASLTNRRDIFTFLSRPVTRLPRIILLLGELLKVTPKEHADKEDIPVLKEMLERVVKDTEHGIEAAAVKIKLWNIAERLLFKKGEITDLDISNPKRTFVHSSYLFRRIRSESNWHGWQDIYAILLDNYLLLTREEEGGKYVVISRKNNTVAMDTMLPAEALMYPFTVSIGGPEGKAYTLCTTDQAHRSEWIDKIQNTQMLRKYDLESNRIFVTHTISMPSKMRSPVICSETFIVHGRDTVAFATETSVWLGWLRDTHSFRELVQLQNGQISSIALVPEFSWLLVLSSGTLLAFNLKRMMPTSDPSTWMSMGRAQGQLLNQSGHSVAWVYTGKTKGRTLITYVVYGRNTHGCTLNFLEPLFDNSYPSASSLLSDPVFRSFASLHLPGHASSITFFRQTVAITTEKTIVIAEPGNPVYNCVPTAGSTAFLAEDAVVAKLLNGQGRTRAEGRPLGMWQTGGDEFILVYDWGACFVTKFGEICRSGAFLIWDLFPVYAIFRSPHLLLFDDSSRAEVRNVTSGKMCEVIEEKGLRMMPRTREEQGMLGWSEKGLIQLVETVEL